MKNTMLFLHAHTSIHAGIGTIDSAIDLPIQREAHTSYPCVFGSSMKGALRAKAEEQSLPNREILFGAAGSNGDNTGGNAGSLLISDARILLLPVRSLTGTFRWVTCPTILTRFQQDMERFGIEQNFTLPSVKQGEVALCDKQETLYLEEYRLQATSESIDDALITALAPALSYSDREDMLRAQLAIISDGDFAYLAKYTLPVNAHIAIQEGTKIVQGGALWYEETLPSDSILYVGVAAAKSRQYELDENGNRQPVEKSAKDIRTNFHSLFTDDPWLQIGGNETVGMGWCHVHLLSKEED